MTEPNDTLSLLADQPFSAKGPWLVLEEGRGTCTTKHALLKACIATLSAGEPSP